MTARSAKALLWLELLGLLLPATLSVALLVLLGLPALPERRLSLPQLAFDLAILLLAAGLAAGWRLGLRYISRGRRGLQQLHPAWMGVLDAATLAGLAGAVIAGAHLLHPLAPGVAVGFALLAPGALLAPLTLRLRHEKKTGR